jgi:hypothetical protein
MDLGRRIDELRARPLEGLLEEAWASRMARWGDRISMSTPSVHPYRTPDHRSAPGAWAQFSVTGTECALGCAHCGGQVLGMMERARSPEHLLEECRRRAREGGLEGVLVSGGSDPDGTVPLAPYLDALRELKRMGLEVLVHTGLVDDAMARGLARAGVDLAMTDVIGSRDVAARVCHLDRPPEAWEGTLRALSRAGVPIAPHIVAGLDWGGLGHEWRALAMSLAAAPAMLVIIVLTPTPGTEMAGAAPPPPEEVARLGAVARLAAPSVPLALGCVKPSGPARGLIERGMVDAGVNAVAYPLPATVGHARGRGLKVEFDDRCCALLGTPPLTARP